MEICLFPDPKLAMVAGASAVRTRRPTIFLTAAFSRYIARRYFTVVALNFADTTELDRAIAADLRRHHYEPVQVIPYGIEVPALRQGNYVIYRYEPAQ